MRTSFIPAIEGLFARESATPAPKSKRGGAVKYGLTRRIYANWLGCKCADVALESIEAGLATCILDLWFWRQVRADELPEVIDDIVFRRAVRDGVTKAIEDLQFALRIRPDGKMTGRVLRAVERADRDDLIARLS
jgi:lysozyme family protein